MNMKPTKHDPEELKEVGKELRDVIDAHRDLLNDEPRILNPLLDAARAAKAKYDDLKHSR